MSLNVLAALIRKDLLIFFTDRYAVILSFAAPIALASFMAAIFGGAGPSTATKIPIRLVDLDGGEVARSIVARARSEAMLDAAAAPREQAESAVRRGEAVAAVVIPEGFGDRAAEAVFGGPEPPELTFIGDPTHGSDLSLVRGLLTRLVLEAVTAGSLGDGAGGGLLDGLDRDGDPVGRAIGESLAGTADDGVDRAEFLGLFPGLSPDGPVEDEARSDLLAAFPGLEGWFRPGGREAGPGPDPAGASSGLRMPFATRDVSIARGPDGTRAALAGHAFASMAVQFVLFSAIEWGIGLIQERQRGIWKRLRAAPVARATLLASKALGSAIVALSITLAVLGFGAVVFRFRVQGDPSALILVAVGYALTASTFGLLVAAVGRTPQAARSISILVVLVMVLLGGGWIPGFLFPAWLNRLTVAVPTRWAIDGFDGVLSRGFTLGESMPTLAALGAFSALFAALAVLGGHRGRRIIRR